MTGFRDGLQERVLGVKYEHRILSAETEGVGHADLTERGVSDFLELE